MHVKWLFFDKTDKEKESTRLLVGNSKNLLNLLTRLLEEDLKHLEAKQTSNDTFDSPSWAQQQAFFLGQKKSLLDLIKLTKDI